MRSMMRGFDSNVIARYKEAQIHGAVCLQRHVALVVPDPSTQCISLAEQLAAHCTAKVLWIDRVGWPGNKRAKTAIAPPRGGKGTRASVPINCDKTREPFDFAPPPRMDD